MNEPTVEMIQVGQTCGVRVLGLSADEAEGLYERVVALVGELEAGPTHGDQP